MVTNFRIALVLVFVILCSGCSLLPKEEKPLTPPLTKPTKQNYETITVEKGDIYKEVRGVAVFESEEKAYHSFTFSGGRIAEVAVKAGDLVSEGTLLMSLETDQLDLTWKEHRLAVERAKMALEQAKHAGDHPLVKIRFMELDIAETRLQYVEEQMEDKQLKASMSGRVTFVERMKAGDPVLGGQVLVIIENPQKLRLSYKGDGRYIADVKVGMQALIEINDLKLTGEIVQTPSSAPYTDNPVLRETYTKTLYIDPEKVPEGISFGDIATINIITQERKNVVVVPKRAVRQYFGRSYVHVLEGTSIKEVDVETGIETAREFEIVSGLESGQTIVLQ